jgi:hypothetical protein
VTTVRCPACDAAVASGAPWCTLCFTDLRPAAPSRAEAAAPPPAPARAHAQASGSAYVPAHAQSRAPASAPSYELAPLYEPAPSPAALIEALPPSILDGPVATQADIRLAEPGWPCQGCGAVVALDLADCPHCGGSFLGGSKVEVSLRIPGVGDMAKMSPAGRAGVMAGLAGVLALVLVLLYLVLGHFV